MKELIITLCIAASGICWSIVYVDSIRTGFKQRTCCMPLFALGLNIAWEGVCICFLHHVMQKEIVISSGR